MDALGKIGLSRRARPRARSTSGRKIPEGYTSADFAEQGARGGQRHRRRGHRVRPRRRGLHPHLARPRRTTVSTRPSRASRRSSRARPRRHEFAPLQASTVRRQASEDRAVLVGVDLGSRSWPIEESLAELARLAETAGAEVVGDGHAAAGRAQPAHLHRRRQGRGGRAPGARDRRHARRLRRRPHAVASRRTSRTRSPRSRVLDRTALILDIFALHATSREGKLQVELAQMEYAAAAPQGHVGPPGRRARSAAGAARGSAPASRSWRPTAGSTRRRIAELKRELKQRGRTTRVQQRKARRAVGRLPRLARRLHERRQVHAAGTR